MDTMTTRDIFVRHTAADGKSYVTSHRVWDAERFMTSLNRAAAKVNEKQDPGATRKARVDQITEEQYSAARAA